MKRLAFILLTLLIPLVGVLFIEGVLRIFVPGTPPPMIRKLGDVEGRSFMLFDRVGPASFFGPQAHRMSPAEITGFFMPKPTNTIRVILTGESAMRGFPQPDAFTAASILEEMLRDDYPGRDIEVLNFAATAVASYPVLKITEAALACDPDAIVTLVGHNEYFGAYGVLSTRHIGSMAPLFGLDYALKHSALGRVLARAAQLFSKDDVRGKQLMEMMATADSVPYPSPLRDRALANLRRHTDALARACLSAEIPLVLCIPPSNESDLRPIGPDEDTGVVDGRSAVGSFEFARQLQDAGRYAEAEPYFKDARDRDAMPWRASSLIQEAIREVAADKSAVVCDVDRVFRERGGDDGIGWNLMDDHVHPNIDGQALMADAIRHSLHEILGAPDQQQEAKTHQQYLEQLGDNIYDRLSVAGMMVTLLKIPFLAESNPEAITHFERVGKGYLSQIPREVYGAVNNWQRSPTLSIGKRPLSGLAAIEWLKQNRPDQAIPLLESAIRSVPEYTSWSLEYTYFLLSAIELRDGLLDPSHIDMAEAALERGKILTELGDARSGQSERFMGRILQVLYRPSEAIPYLKKASERLTGMDLTANNRALVEALKEVGRDEEAEQILRTSVPSHRLPPQR